MLDELRVGPIKKKDVKSPHLQLLLVVDAMTGQPPSTWRRRRASK
jgi:hypothetical protein